MQKKSRENYIVFKWFRGCRNGKLPCIIVKGLALQHSQGTVIISIQSESTSLSFFNNP